MFQKKEQDLLFNLSAYRSDVYFNPDFLEVDRVLDVRIVPYNWAESFRFGSGAMGLEVLAGIRVQIVQGANKVLGEGMLPLDQVFAKLDHDGYLRHVVHVKNEAGEQGVERERGG